MNYIFLRLLTFLKGIVGALATVTMDLYLYLMAVIRDGADKQVTKIREAEKKTVDKAKAGVIAMAKKLVEMEASIPELETKVKAKADTKIHKVKTKIK